MAQACTAGQWKPNTVNANHFLHDQFPENKKAMIVTKNPNGATLWYRIDEKFNIKKSWDNFWISKDNNYDLIMLEPGVYSLSTFYDKNDDQVYFKASGSILPSSSSFLIYFEVKEGEVLYIGDIHTSGIRIGKFFDNSATGGIRVENNSTEAKEYVTKQHPELLNRFKTRLAIPRK